MRGRVLSWVALGAIVLATTAVLVVRSRPSDAPAARAARLERKLACVECAGESVRDSNSPMARAVRVDVDKRIAAGERDAQILGAVRRAYGDRVLLVPANRGIGLVVWMVPTIAVLLGGAGIVLALRRWSRAPRLDASSDDEHIVDVARSEPQ
jgi:cytochrome c-type biogenesis protein CcmH